jgi:type IV secretion system protein VirB1
MPLSIVTALALASQCAPSVAPETLLSVVAAESRFNPLAIGVNGAPPVTVNVTTKEQAVARASALIAGGRSVDLGLAQINSGNLSRLGLSVADAFDPCRNLAAAARVLREGYSPSAGDDPQLALLRALSRYNTGHARRGFTNGYVAKVMNAATQIVPALRAESSPVAQTHHVETAAAPPRLTWDVFGETAGSDGFLIRPDSPAPPAVGAQP